MVSESHVPALRGSRPYSPESQGLEPAPLEVPSDEGDQAAPVDFDRLSRDQISKRIGARFHGHELAQLVGEILHAEGFVTSVSPAGPDVGVDILAGQGSMGFDGAMLAVQVKSGAQQADAPTLRELQGVMSNFGATRGLLVSWGGFTKAARAEARRLFFRLYMTMSLDDYVTGPQDSADALPSRAPNRHASEPCRPSGSAQADHQFWAFLALPRDRPRWAWAAIGWRRSTCTPGARFIWDFSADPGFQKPSSVCAGLRADQRIWAA
jgi:hypothetical protein